jgi:hypothetical protein
MLTDSIVYELITSIEQYHQQRYIMLAADASAYYTIFRMIKTKRTNACKYVVVESPVFETYTPDAIADVAFYEVYMNESTTQMTFTAFGDAVPLSYSVKSSAVEIQYENSEYPLQFVCPYVSTQQIPFLKEMILNLFACPTHMILLYGELMLQLNYIPTASPIPQAFQVTISASFFKIRLDEEKALISTFILHNFFDFNKTMIILFGEDPFLVLNSQSFTIGNAQPYLYNSNSSEYPFQAVIGNHHTYTVDNNATSSTTIVRRIMKNLNNQTLNYQGTNEITNVKKSLGYTSLTSIAFLKRTNELGYFLNGIGGLLYNNYYDPLQKGWALINQSNLQNSNNVVTSSSYALFYASSTSGLTQYGSTTLWYKIDTDLRTLTVWEDPSTPSFSSYLLEHTATLSQTDIVPLTKTQSNLIKKEVNGLNLLNDDTKMGGFWNRLRNFVANNPVAAKVIGVIAVVVVVVAVASAIVVTVGAAGIVLGATFTQAAAATAGAGITTVIKTTDVISGKQGANQV